MKLYLVSLAVLLLAGSAASLRCYRCYDMLSHSDDPGLSFLFNYYQSQNNPPCDPDKKASYLKTCNAHEEMCGTMSIVDWEFETIAPDGTKETGTVERYFHRGCVPLSLKDVPEGCYPAEELEYIFENAIRLGLGGFTGEVNLKTPGTICVCKTGWCNDHEFDPFP